MFCDVVLYIPEKGRKGIEKKIEKRGVEKDREGQEGRVKEKWTAVDKRRNKNTLPFSLHTASQAGPYSHQSMFWWQNTTGSKTFKSEASLLAILLQL